MLFCIEISITLLFSRCNQLQCIFHNGDLSRTARNRVNSIWLLWEHEFSILTFNIGNGVKFSISKDYGAGELRDVPMTKIQILFGNGSYPLFTNLQLSNKWHRCTIFVCKWEGWFLEHLLILRINKGLNRVPQCMLIFVSQSSRSSASWGKISYGFLFSFLCTLFAYLGKVVGYIYPGICILPYKVIYHSWVMKNWVDI